METFVWWEERYCLLYCIYEHMYITALTSYIRVLEKQLLLSSSHLCWATVQSILFYSRYIHMYNDVHIHVHVDDVRVLCMHVWTSV